MKRILIVLLVIVSAVLLWQFYQLYIEQRGLNEAVAAISERASDLSVENHRFISDLQYLSEPENLLKELRSRFNYKKPGEKLLITIPAKQE